MAEGAMSVVQLASQKTATLLLNEGRNYLLTENEPIEKLYVGLEWMHCFLKDVPKNQCIWISQIRDLAHEAEDIIDKFLVRISLRDKEGIRNAITRYFRDAKELSKIGDDIYAWSYRLAEFITRIKKFNSQVHLDGTATISIPATSDIHRWQFTATSSASQPSSSSQQEPEIIIGLDEDVKDLGNRLVHSTMKVIYIYGSSGSGKTTLAKKVCNDETVRSYFDTIVWISGSHKISAREALETIWVKLYGGDHHGQRKMIKRLKDEELQNKIKVEMEKSKYLVVYDNLRIEGSWDILQPALHVPRNSGSKLMIPTHYRVDLSRLPLSDYRYYLQMKPLKKDDRWKLLSKIASRGGYQPDWRMRDWWDKISQFDGLNPLAIIVLGGVLQSKNEQSKWRDVIKDLKEPGLLVQVLELSYNDLPFHLKCCFVRLAALPPCFEVPVENLYQMWIAEELVTLQPNDSMSLHEKAKGYLNDLVKRCLVQIGRKGKNGEIESCGMHNYIREFCSRKQKEEYFSSLTVVGREVEKIKTQISKETGKPASSADKKTATQDNKKSTANPQQNKTSTSTTPSSTVNLSIRRLHHLAIHQYTGRGKSQKEVLCAIEDRQHLRSLLIFSSRFKILPRKSWLKSLHGGTSTLRVLHLEDTKMRTLPHQIGELCHLKYLSLRGTKVTRALPSSLGNLLMLETLDLRAVGSYGLVHGLARHGKGNAVNIPNVLWKLNSLRHLYLPESYMVSMFQRLKVDSLTQLETLENLELRSCEVEGLVKLTGLRNFTWMIQDTNGMFEKSDKKILQGLLNCPSLVAVGQESHGSSETETNLPRKFIKIKIVGEMLSKKFADKLVKLPGYEKCVRGLTIWGPISCLKLTDIEMVFKNLTSLALWLTELPDPMPIFGVLPVLKELCLSYLSSTGTKMNCPDNSFPELEFLKLELLSELQNLTLGMNCMPKLHRVEIKYCHKLQIADSLKGKLVKTE